MTLFNELEPKEMTTERLREISDEGWSRVVLGRGVMIYGLFLFIGLCLIHLVVGGNIEGEDVLFSLAMGTVGGAVFGAYLNYSINAELKKRTHL